MMRLDVDENGYLYDRDAPDYPRERSWREFFEDCLDWSSLDDAERAEIMAEHCLETEAHLDGMIDEEILLGSYLHETPFGVAFTVLHASLGSDPEASEVVTFWDGPSPGCDFQGVELVGLKGELHRLLVKHGLASSIRLEEAYRGEFDDDVAQSMTFDDATEKGIAALIESIVAGWPKPHNWITAMGHSGRKQDLERRIRGHFHRTGTLPKPGNWSEFWSVSDRLEIEEG